MLMYENMSCIWNLDHYGMKYDTKKAGFFLLRGSPTAITINQDDMLDRSTFLICIMAKQVDVGGRASGELEIWKMIRS